MNEKILFRYIQELSDAAERELVAAWLQESPKNRDILVALVKRKQALEAAADQQHANFHWERIQAAMNQEADTAPVIRRLPVRRIIRYSAAATLALLVTGMGWLWKQHAARTPVEMVKLATTGKNKQMITLPDGTEVWLQYNSTLEYDAHAFNTSNRQLIMTGDAFFNVAASPDKPFQVRTLQTTITVLGTAFSISAREHAQQEIAVASGKINVQAEKMNINLLPMQRITYNPVTHTMHSDSASLDHITAVRDNQLVFENDDLQSIAAKLSRWYNRKVVIQGTPRQVSFTGNVQDNGLQPVLEGLSFLAGVSYDITPDSILLSLKRNHKK
ncbi:FecR family protein [Chitinophaga arvensicola]|uniref:Ferric-dicitrate binding protein FerR, regulates iron transport through sigma-19 n=1 Tax=Chitinophaga arvensicola TaxID=29529 RepID=A0A1I0RQ22_9BACT|nr:FecR family protein [Chitinophaga arvensicola]SEW43374.1 ferric-dicitrate binding protein FerR, regulates iron transport through sigma-19 [Chitinophaga arvensicola]